MRTFARWNRSPEQDVRTGVLFFWIRLTRLDCFSLLHTIAVREFIDYVTDNVNVCCTAIYISTVTHKNVLRLKSFETDHVSITPKTVDLPISVHRGHPGSRWLVRMPENKTLSINLFRKTSIILSYIESTQNDVPKWDWLILQVRVQSITFRYRFAYAPLAIVQIARATFWNENPPARQLHPLLLKQMESVA